MKYACCCYENPCKSLSVFALTLTLAASAQKPPQSPPAQADVTLAGKPLTVKYSSPQMRGRKIMGELVPFGQVWRTGANPATTLVTPVDLMIGTLKVPAGTYTLFTASGLRARMGNSS